MRYSMEQKFAGQEAEAFSAIESILLPNGFRITRSEDSILELKGRGMQSSRENPVRGATVVEVKAREGVLHLDARLGGVVFMVLFVCLFPVLLLGSFAVAPMFESGGGVASLNTEVYRGMAVWAVLGPLAGVWIRHRTIVALKDMMDNAVACAGRGSKME